MLRGLATKALGRIGLVTGIGFGALDYLSARQEGYGVLPAAAQAAGMAAFYSLSPLWLIGMVQAAQIVPQLAVMGLDWSSQRASYLRWAAGRGLVGGGYVDTAAAYTMRQAAMQEINNSLANAGAVLGNEAWLLWRR